MDLNNASPAVNPNAVHAEVTAAEREALFPQPSLAVIDASRGTVANGIAIDTDTLLKRKGIAHWPSVEDALHRWAEGIERQLPKDIDAVPLKAIAMDALTGGLYRKGHNAAHALVPTYTALGHLLSYVSDKPQAATANLSHYSPRTRAAMLEELLASANDRSVVLRTALGSQSRVVRAVVSDKHSLADGDDLTVVSALQRMLGRNTLPANAKMKVHRQWDTTAVEIVLPSTERMLTKGRPAYGRILITNSETKGGAFEAQAGVFSLVCLNGMTSDASNRTSFSVRHVGNIESKIRVAVEVAARRLPEALAEMSATYRQALPAPRAEFLERAVKTLKLPEAAGVSMAALWDADGDASGGDTFGGFLDSVTRYAQTLPVQRGYEMEAVASKALSMGLDAFVR